MPENPYKVRQTERGCIMCGHDALWSVVGPDAVALSGDYAKEEDAEYMAQELNAAYDMGRAAKKRLKLKKDKKQSKHPRYKKV